MEQVQATNYDFSKIDFSSEKAYAYLMLENEIEKTKRHKMLETEAKRRGQEDLFKDMVEAFKKELKKKKKSSDNQQKQIAYEYTPNGTPLRIWENLQALYEYKGIELKYNELKRCIEGNQGWYVYEDFLIQINSDCKRTGLNLSKDNLWDFSSYIANKKAYNPVKQYLENAYKKYKEIGGEKESQLGKLLKTITYPKHYTEQDIAFNEKIILMWLLTGVKMGMNNGTENAEFAIVFKGKQGMGKTRWFRSLIPKEHLIQFFKDGVQLDLSKKDDIIQATSYWLCELGELGATMKKSDRDALKAWLTSTHDEFRTPYARKAEKHPRRTFFACTVNDDEFLRDDTGNRRFVVIEVDKLDHIHDVDIDLMWGEVVELLQEGNKTYLDQNDIEYNNQRNKVYMVKTNEQMILEEYLPLNQPREEWKHITATALCDYIQETHGKALAPARVGKALSNMGFKQEPKRINKSFGKYYLMPYLKNYSMPI